MKHAYLIMAHNQFKLLEILIKLLDYEKHDIYIHIDKKVNNFDFDYFKNLVSKSKIYFVERENVYWGHYSIVKTTINLLATAKKQERYRYYHLLSGVDLPLKKAKDVYDFFDSDLEYVHFAPKNLLLKEIDRYNFNWRFIKYKKNNTYKGYIYRTIDEINILIQKILNKNKLNKENVEIQYGSAWFSITDSFVKYILSKENWINSVYKNSLLPDESFIQTLIYNSKFKEKLYYPIEQQIYDDHQACLRKIDWKRGAPYVWSINDYRELMNSNCLFARKFDLNKDRNIIYKIYKTLNE